MNLLAAALALQLVHLVYHQVTTLFDFFPFNGVRFSSRREQHIESAVNLVLMGFPPLGFMLRVPFLMELGVVCYFVTLGGECATWWAPYFFGASPKWQEIYSRVQGRTITVIPRHGKNPTPNLEHLILMALTLATAVTTLVAYRALPGAAFPHAWFMLPLAAVIVSGAVYQCCLEGREKVKPPAG